MCRSRRCARGISTETEGHGRDVEVKDLLGVQGRTQEMRRELSRLAGISRRSSRSRGFRRWGSWIATTLQMWRSWGGLVYRSPAALLLRSPEVGTAKQVEHCRSLASGMVARGRLLC